jgi:hypothetical protein
VDALTEQCKEGKEDVSGESAWVWTWNVVEGSGRCGFSLLEPEYQKPSRSRGLPRDYYIKGLITYFLGQALGWLAALCHWSCQNAVFGETGLEMAQHARFLRPLPAVSMRTPLLYFVPLPAPRFRHIKSPAPAWHH